MELAQNMMNPANALRQARRAGLQDVRRFDFEDSVVDHRADAVPAVPFADPRRLHFLAAPRREHHLRVRAARPLKRSTMRLRARRASASSGKIGSPPAISTSSSTHRIPEINGSSHSSKKTRNRRGKRAADSRMRSRFAASRSASCSASAWQPTSPPSIRIICRISATGALVERDDGDAALDELGGEVGLQIGEREHEIGPERLDACRTSR